MDRLYCFGESGNAYKVAMMLMLCDIPWEPVFVDFFKGETRGEPYRSSVNAMGEAPVLDRAGRRLSQSGVILSVLARETGRFVPDDPDECWRWILFDNQKFTGSFAPLRFLRSFAPKPVDPAVIAFMAGRMKAAFDIAERHLGSRSFVLGEQPTIADLSMAGYVFFPTEETGLDLPAAYPALDRWRQRIAALPGWRAPYDCMPRAFPGASAGR